MRILFKIQQIYTTHQLTALTKIKYTHILMLSNPYINTGGVHYSAGLSSNAEAYNQCGNVRGGRRRGKSSSKRRKRTLSKRKHRTRRGRKRKFTRGGYYQYGSNLNTTPTGYAFNPSIVTPYSSALANPLPFARF